MSSKAIVELIENVGLVIKVRRGSECSATVITNDIWLGEGAQDSFLEHARLIAQGALDALEDLR